MAVTFGHTFEISAGDLSYEGDVDLVTGTYSEDQPEELPAKLETDFKLVVEALAKFYDTYGSLEKFEVVVKE